MTFLVLKMMGQAITTGSVYKVVGVWEMYGLTITFDVNYQKETKSV